MTIPSGIKGSQCDENIVYILGAGFSAYAGIPVMSNFLMKSKDMYFENPEKYASFEELFQKFDRMAKIKNYFSANLFNIEEILSILEIQEAVGGSVSDRQKFLTYIKDVIEYYSFPAEAFRTQVDDSFNLERCLFSKDNHRLNEYGIFVASLMQVNIGLNQVETSLSSSVCKTKNHYSVVSFNYDTIVEQLVDFINPSVKSNGSFVFEITKLHGSITEPNTIIPPTWAKSIKPEMMQTWKDAYTKLKNATQIRIIGYSLPITDSYFRYFLKAALLDNNRLKKMDIICYDPSESVVQNYRDFIEPQFPYFRFLNKKIDDFMALLFDRTTNDSDPARGVSCSHLEEIHERFMEEE